MRLTTVVTDRTSRRNSVNSRQSPISARLMPFVANAAKAEPVKVLAIKTGISARVLTDLREERHMPSMPTFFALAIHDPQLRAQAVAILTGEAEAGAPENIDRLVRSFTSKGDR